MKFTVWMDSDDTAGEPIALAQIERHGPVAAAKLGLTLAESKDITSATQRALVQAQFRDYLTAQRICSTCGGRRKVKDYHDVHFKSLFGGVPLRIPRLFGCGCDREPGRARTVRIDGLNTWVAPELEYVQSYLSATLAYARATRFLELLLPVTAGNAVSSVRRHTLAVGERLDNELNEAADVDHETSADTPAIVAMGLDSGYVRHSQPDAERCFEVVVGRILADDSSSRSVGFVRTVENNDQVRHRLQHRVAEQGHAADGVVVFTDGDPGMRLLQLSALPKATHVLDWFHLTRHLTVLKTVLNGKPAVAQLPPEYHGPLRKDLDSLKWCLWHGQQWRSRRKLESMLFTLRLPTIASKRATVGLRRLCKKLMKYLTNNADSLPDYGKRYRAGERISTSFVESAVNQLIDWRMSKSQQMRWSRMGAHHLLQVRAEVVDGRLGETFTPLVSGVRCATIRGCNSRVTPSFEPDS